MIELLNEAGGRWAPYFGLALVQNTIFLLFVYAALRLMKNASARARYAVSMVGLIKLVLPPFLRVPDFTAHGLAIPSPLNDFSGFSLLFADAAPVETVASSPSVGFAGGVLAIWIVGGLIALILPGISTARLVWRLRGSQKVAAEVSEALGVPAGIRIHLSRRIAMPLTLGVLPRKIYVPAAWKEWSDECRRMFLRHEMAHIERADGAAMLIQSIARAIYFFHPLYFWLQGRLHEYREMACDEISIAPTESAAVDYSRYLVDVAESALCSAAVYESASALIPRRHELSKRVEYLMKGRAMRSHSKARSGWIVAGLVLLLLPLSWYAGEVTPGSVDAQAAAMGDKSHPKKGELKTVKMELKEGGGIDIAGESTEVAKLGKSFVSYALGLDNKFAEETVIYIKCDDGVTMEQLHGVQKILTELNLTKVKYGHGDGPGLPLELPAQKMIEKLVGLPEKDVAALEVLPSGEMILAGKKVKSADVADHVAKLLQENEHLVITIDTHAETRYEDFVTALDQTKKGGCKRIAVLPPKPPKS